MGFQDFDKVVFLVRDPLDIIASVFHHRVNNVDESSLIDIRLPEGITLNEFANATHLRGGVATLASFLNTWIPVVSAMKQRVIIVSYEALQACPQHVLSHVLNRFLNLGVPCKAIRLAIASTRMDSLR